jgi:hypothetical protein
VLVAFPGARLLLAGFGELRDELEALMRVLGEEVGSSISVSCRLEHAELAEVMPAARTLVMASVFPEAFGIVAAEAAACGVPPVSADHSGMREVSRQLAEAVPDHAGLLSFEVGDESVEAIAERVNGWLALSAGERERVGRALSERVHELWSWERVAEGVIAATRGELDERHGDVRLGAFRRVARRVHLGLDSRLRMDLEGDASEPSGEPDWDVVAGPQGVLSLGRFALTAGGGVSAVKLREGGPATVGARITTGVGSAF